MIRTLIASIAVSMTAAALACDTCGCRTPAECTGNTTQVKSTDGASCAATCQAAGSVASVTNVSGGAACSAPCSGGEAATTSLVSYMPKMTYRVGQEETCCPKTAGEMAAKAQDHVHYVVNEVAYDDQAEAIEAHAAQLQTYMMDLVRIQLAVDGECVACPDKAKEMAASCSDKKMQYKVGPALFDSADAAIRASMMAWNAAQNVSMEYAVGEETTQCSVDAKEMAQKAGCSVEYVVNGQRTNCSKMAGYLKTVASVESALKAIETVAGNA